MSASRCANAEQVYKMMEDRFAELMQFIGTVAKKLPTPAEIEVRKKYLGAQRQIVLRFRCARAPGVTLEIVSSQWSKWLKFGVSLMKAGKCALTGDVEGVKAQGIEAARAAYDALSDRKKRKATKDESGGFDKLLREPFLLSSEQDELISGLRRKGFFEKFAYDAANAEWYARDAYAKSREREKRSK